MVLLVVFLASLHAQMEKETAAMLVKGELSNAISATADQTLKDNLGRLLKVDELFLEGLADMQEVELTITNQGREEKGTVVKVEGGSIFVRVVKEEIGASTTYPVSVRSLPPEQKMAAIKLPPEFQHIYFAVRSLKSRNYAAAIHHLSRTGSYADALETAADAECGHMISLWKAIAGEDLQKLEDVMPKVADINAKQLIEAFNQRAGRIEKIETTALLQAVKTQNKDAVSMLLKNGAKVNIPNSNGVTPVMIAVLLQKEDPAVLEMLIRAGANLRACDNAGNTVLTGAIAARKNQAVELLLKHGADINQTRPDGITPIMMCIMANNPEAFLLLQEKGADMTRRHPDGWTLFDLDRSHLDPRIKTVLDTISPPKAPRSTSPGFPGIDGIKVVPRRN